MNNFKVALTIGHSKESPGAVNQGYMINEYEICKKITDYAANCFPKEYDLCIEDNWTLGQEKDKIDKFKADVIVENHMNFASDTKKTGIMTIYEKDNAESMLLAFAVHEKLILALLRQDLGVINHETIKGWREWVSFFLFDKIKYQNRFGFDVPTILTEIDYISNSDVAEMIMDKNEDFIKKAGKAIADGIIKYNEDKLNKGMIT